MAIRRFLIPLCLLGFCSMAEALLAQDYGHRRAALRFAGDPGAAAILQAAEAAFPAPLRQGAQFEVAHRIESPGGIHYSLGLRRGGLPVADAQLKATLSPAGHLMSWGCALPAWRWEAPADFRFSDTLIATRCAESLGAWRVEVKRARAVLGDSLLPVYLAQAFSHTLPALVEVRYDARSGAELAREDLGAYHSAGDSSGRGLVFLPDPCTRAQAPYAAAFTDNGDQHSPLFGQLMDTVHLRGLRYENGLFLLEGPYVRIEDISLFTAPPATSASGDFFFERSASGFEDVMVYYHLDSFQRYIQRLGFFNLQNRPFRADPHGQGDADQSVFVPNGTQSYILFGEGGVDDAEDADVIIHEYGHALSEDAAPGSRTGLERRGLDEGIGDYVAAAYSYDLSSWQWSNLFNWDGHNEFWPGRVAATMETYPPTSSSIYAYGRLWAATLMQLRQEIGAETCDRLVLQQMYGNFRNMSLADGVRLLIEADTLLYQGVHTQAIQRLFCQREIIEGPDCQAVSASDELDAARWQIFPNPSAGLLQVEGPQPFRVEIFDVLGRLAGRFEAAGGRLSCQPALAPGLYQLRIVAEGQERFRGAWIRQ